MKNLQKIITSTYKTIKQQEQEMQSQVLELHTLGNSILKDTDYTKNADLKLLEKQECIFATLSQIRQSVAQYKNDIQEHSWEQEQTNEIIKILSPVKDMVASIKSLETTLILAQNKCALNGDKENADKLAEASLELNYHNHIFLKDVSKDIMSIKSKIKE